MYVLRKTKQQLENIKLELTIKNRFQRYSQVGCVFSKKKLAACFVNLNCI